MEIISSLTALIFFGKKGSLPLFVDANISSTIKNYLAISSFGLAKTKKLFSE
jgi:hypothetical protein